MAIVLNQTNFSKTSLTKRTAIGNNGPAAFLLSATHMYR
jgi:hypothetical protein